MGIGDFVNSVGDAIEHGLESAKEKAGELADAGLDAAAGLARRVGADSVAENLDDLGDRIADLAGGEVRERELGESTDPKELIRGEPPAIHDTAEAVKQMGDSIEKTGDALRTIDTANWTGAAAQEFHEEFAKQPKLWWEGADAMHKASGVLDGWYHDVTAAQAKAADAIAKWEAADTEERTKKNQWNALSDEQKSKTPLTDTWTALRDEARDILRGARSQRDNAANSVAAALAAATESAPTEPPFTQRWSSNLSDLSNISDHAKLNFTSGLLTSFTGIVQFVRQVSPMDQYNLTHPAEYLSSMSDLGTGLAVAAADPGATVSSLLSGARRNPSEFLGSLTGDLITTIGTGGAGAAKPALSALDKVSDVSKVSRVTHTATSVAEHVPSGRGVPHTAEPAPSAHPSTSHNPAPAEATTPKPETGSPQPATNTHPDSASPERPTQQPTSPADAPRTPDSTSPQHAPETPDGSPQQQPEAQQSKPEPSEQAHPEPSQQTRPDPAQQAHPDTSSPDSAPPRSDTTPHNEHPDSTPQQAHPAERPSDPTPPVHDSPPSAPHTDGQTPHPSSETHPPAHESSPHTDSPASDHQRPDTDTSRSDPSAPHPDDAHPGSHPDDASGPHDRGPDDQPHVPDNATPHDRADADQGASDHARDSDADNNRTPQDTCSGRDPVDISTGEFLLPETDLDLPGVLHLVLRRTHRSGYRFGRWFGPSWSATLDMRLVVEHEGVTFIGEDGLLLLYPHAEVGLAVEPITGGQRWTLTRTETGGYRIWDQSREMIWHFAPEPVLGGLETRLGNYAISAITDRHRNRIRFHYDPDGNPVEVSHSGGYRVRVDTANGRVTGLAVLGADTATTVREFGYDTGQLTSVVNAAGATTRYVYDDEHRMTSWIDSNGNEMVNTYDESGRVRHQRGTAGVMNSDFDYLDFPDGTGRLTTVTDSLGAVTTHGFDRDLRLRDLVDPVGNRTHYDYNADRNPLQVTAPDGAITRYRYTAEGDVAEITRPDGATISLEYFWRKRPSAITEAAGTVRRQEWDKDGNLTAVIDAAGVRTEYQHAPNGAVTAITASTGARTTIDVDPAGQPVRITDPYGAVTTIERDHFGRPITVTDPLGARTAYEWAPDGKLLRRTDPDGYAESRTYDGEYNLLTHTNRAGYVTTFTYGAFDLLQSRTEPDGATTRYTWDTERRLTTVTNPLGHTWTYEYDPAGRLIAETDYNEATTRYTHDRAGRVATVTPATGVTRHHTYDVLGRLINITADTGEWLRYSHDPNGRVLTAVSGSDEEAAHKVEFTYAATGNILSERLDEHSPVSFSYDEHGRRTRRITPSGTTTEWNYDLTGRVREISADGQRIDFLVDALGRRTGWRFHEIAVDRTLSQLGYIEEQKVIAHPASSLDLDFDGHSRPPSRVLRRDRYTYRPDGYLISQNSNINAGEELQRDYRLDAVGRITEITRGSVSVEQYTYDLLSNVTSSRSTASPGIILTNESTQPIANSGERGIDTLSSEEIPSPRRYQRSLLTEDGRVYFQYDPAGRLIRESKVLNSDTTSVCHYRYNAFDQLTDVWTADNKWWKYSYDALGRRVDKRQLSTDGRILKQFKYTWDGVQVIEQSTDYTSTRWQYQPDSLIPIAQITQEHDKQTSVAIICDPSGLPTTTVNPLSGNVVAIAVSDLWGNAAWPEGQDPILRFQGQQYDTETGLHYNLIRFYNPKTGRYLSQDPLGLGPAPNPNIYPRNPTAWADPLGLTPGACEGSNPVYYRTMSEEHYEELVNTGKLPPTSETFISPTREFSESYTGRLVEFELQPGTVEALAEIGVRNSAQAVVDTYPDMPLVYKGWTKYAAHFKGEGFEHINIGLGRGPALDIFNDAILRFREIAR